MTAIWVSVVWAVFLGGLLFAQARSHGRQLVRVLSLAETDRVEQRERTERLLSLVEATQAHASKPHPDVAELVALVDRLCQRIQAPEQAVVEHAMAQPLPPLPMAIEMDDDEGHWESKEQMAEREMAEEQQAMRSMLA